MEAGYLFWLLALGCGGPILPDETSKNDAPHIDGIGHEIRITLDAAAASRLEGYISSIAVGFLAFKGNKDWRLLDRNKVKELHDTLQRKTWETCPGASARRDSLLRLFRLP